MTLGSALATRPLYDERVPMRDGVELSADVFLPDDSGGPWPAILFRTPYDNASPDVVQLGLLYSAHGYAFVAQDVRGRGDSDGRFIPFRQEGEDGHDTIEWVAQQQWCDGAVGTAGGSYCAVAQWLAARERPPHLRAIASAAAPGRWTEELPSLFGTHSSHWINFLNVTSGSDIEAVVIAASSEAHTELILAATAAGKAVFCEKPMGLTIADIDRAIEAARAAGVALQVGFNRRFSADFAAARQLVLDGKIGPPQLIRSVTRDPGLANPGGVPLWTIFLQTLIHDFDTLLWLNPGANATTVYASADALVAPEFEDAGLFDTAIVVIKFDNGAIATAEASFSAVYGYDVRGEVFGSAGMATIGEVARNSLRYHAATAAMPTPCAAMSNCSATPTPPSSQSSPTPSVAAASRL